jgi:hypothetical protein
MFVLPFPLPALLVSDSYMSLGNTFIVAIPPTILAVATLIASIRNGKKADDLHEKVNGRLQELLYKTREEAFAQGRLAGIAEVMKTEDPRQMRLEVGE